MFVLKTNSLLFYFLSFFYDDRQLRSVTTVCQLVWMVVSSSLQMLFLVALLGASFIVMVYAPLHAFVANLASISSPEFIMQLLPGSYVFWFIIGCFYVNFKIESWQRKRAQRAEPTQSISLIRSLWMRVKYKVCIRVKVED